MPKKYFKFFQCFKFESPFNEIIDEFFRTPQPLYFTSVCYKMQTLTLKKLLLSTINILNDLHTLHAPGRS